MYLALAAALLFDSTNAQIKQPHPSNRAKKSNECGSGSARTGRHAATCVVPRPLVAQPRHLAAADDDAPRLRPATTTSAALVSFCCRRCPARIVAEAHCLADARGFRVGANDYASFRGAVSRRESGGAARNQHCFRRRRRLSHTAAPNCARFVRRRRACACAVALPESARCFAFRRHVDAGHGRLSGTAFPTATAAAESTQRRARDASRCGCGAGTECESRHAVRRASAAAAAASCGACRCCRCSGPARAECGAGNAERSGSAGAARPIHRNVAATRRCVDAARLSSSAAAAAATAARRECRCVRAGELRERRIRRASEPPHIRVGDEHRRSATAGVRRLLCCDRRAASAARCICRRLRCGRVQRVEWHRAAAAAAIFGRTARPRAEDAVHRLAA